MSARTDRRLYRAYLLKEGLRMVFRIARQDGLAAAGAALDRWIGWARRCRIPVFVALSRNIIRHRPAIGATFEHGLSNGLVESANTKIRGLRRVAFGFHSPAPLVGLAMLALGGFCPPLPGTARRRGRPARITLTGIRWLRARTALRRCGAILCWMAGLASAWCPVR